jgi:tRNA pseudouridine38-40 synthase
MPNYRLTLAFDGAAYHGWQIQPNAVTVQEVLGRAISQTVGQDIVPMGCGRTDAGVHAESYVASFKVESNLSPERMQAALNSRLSEDIAVTSCEIAPDDFHATLSAKGKVYRYTILAGGVRPVRNRHYVHWLHHDLDVEAMRAAAAHLVGEHDFAAFVTQHDPEKNTVRIIHALDIDRSGRTITITVRGNGFLYNMVRTIVGCLITVGRGRQKPAWLREVLASRDRTCAAETAPARGLTLVEAIY